MAGPKLPPLGLSFSYPSLAFQNAEFRTLDISIMSLAALDAINRTLLGQNAGVAASPSNINVPTTATVLVPASVFPRKCAIYNHGAQAVIISDGGTPAAGAGTAVIQPGGYWERPVCSTSQIKGVTTSGSSNVTVTIY